MKLSKPRGSLSNSRTPPLKAGSRAQLKQLQKIMATALFRPLTADERMQPTWVDGRSMNKVADSFIKPNDRLTSFERLEIYNRVYWFRVLDCLYDDYPGLRAILGERKFMKLATAYLARYPSDSYTLRDLGNRLEQFLQEEPQWGATRTRARYGAFRMGTGCRIRWPCQAGSYSRRHPRYPIVEAAVRFAAVSFVARAGL